MTPDGHAALTEELHHLKTVERPKIIRAIEEARGHGDLSENAEYHAAKEAQGLNERRIAELEEKLLRAEVIDIDKLSSDKVVFGAWVTLVDAEAGLERRYQIVDETEADARLGRISINSPMARALIRRGVGESVEVVTPGGSRFYEITAVEYGAIEEGRPLVRRVSEQERKTNEQAVTDRRAKKKAAAKGTAKKRDAARKSENAASAKKKTTTKRKTPAKKR